MKRLPALVLLAALALPASGWAQDSLEIAKQRELEETKRQARETREVAKKLKGQETQALGRLKRTDRELSLTRNRLRGLMRKRQNLGQQLELTRTDLQHSIQSLSGARERLRRRLRNIYKFGPARELEVMLSQQSFAQLLARWDFLLMVAEQDRQLMEEVRERKEAVETLETRLQGHLSQIERTTRQTTGENQRLAKLRAQRATQVKSIQTQRQAYEAAAAELERTARSLQRLLVRLEQKRRAEAERNQAEGRAPQPYSGDFARGEGSLDWPVRGQMVGRFGPETHPRFGTTINNNGVDIAAQLGTPVRAVAKARVEYTSEDYASYGPIVILNHGDGFFTLYAHLSEILVAVGQEVTAGQIVGRVGDTGSLKGPILHFEVRKGGTALNPEDWLQ
ncbi:MAG: peptidoglycan DD-metalloendopeptidase family protein [Candidatus Eisenbacteria bacterium]|mgnify:CR=1